MQFFPVLAGYQKAQLQILLVVYQALQVAAGEFFHQEAGIGVQSGEEGAGFRISQCI